MENSVLSFHDLYNALAETATDPPALNFYMLNAERAGNWEKAAQFRERVQTALVDRLLLKTGIYIPNPIEHN